MLRLTSIPDLKKYLETRKKMAENQNEGKEQRDPSWAHSQGMVFAFSEAIKAIEAFEQFQYTSKEDKR